MEDYVFSGGKHVGYIVEVIETRQGTFPKARVDGFNMFIIIAGQNNWHLLRPLEVKITCTKYLILWRCYIAGADQMNLSFTNFEGIPNILNFKE